MVPQSKYIIEEGYYGLSCIPGPPPNSYVEALTPNVTVFGDEAFKEVTMVK